MPTLGPDTTVVVQPPQSPTVQTVVPTAAGLIVIPQPGPPGPPGSGSGVVYTQGTAAATWTITTALGRKPYSVNVFDSSGNAIIADVALPSTSQIVVTFATPQTGSVSYT